jgi:hypothetical protein
MVIEMEGDFHAGAYRSDKKDLCLMAPVTLDGLRRT